MENQLLVALSKTKVKAHTRTSKSGKTVQVKAYQRTALDVLRDYLTSSPAASDDDLRRRVIDETGAPPTRNDIARARKLQSAAPAPQEARKKKAKQPEIDPARVQKAHSQIRALVQARVPDGDLSRLSDDEVLQFSRELGFRAGSMDVGSIERAFLRLTPEQQAAAEEMSPKAGEQARSHAERLGKSADEGFVRDLTRGLLGPEPGSEPLTRQPGSPDGSDRQQEIMAEALRTGEISGGDWDSLTSSQRDRLSAQMEEKFGASPLQEPGPLSFGSASPQDVQNDLQAITGAESVLDIVQRLQGSPVMEQLSPAEQLAYIQALMGSGAVR